MAKNPQDAPIEYYTREHLLHCQQHMRVTKVLTQGLSRVRYWKCPACGKCASTCEELPPTRGDHIRELRRH